MEETAVIETQRAVGLVLGTSISATEPPIANAASRGLDGSSEQAVHCECLHTIAAAEFIKLFETIKM